MVDDVDVTPQAPKSRSLVALLAVQAGEVVSSDRLIDELWPDLDVERARRVLWVRIAELRAALRKAGAADVLVSVPPGYRLDLGPEGLDSARFVAGVRCAATLRAGGEHAAAARVLGDALALWRGPVLADAQGCLALETEARRLTDAFVDASEDWIDAELRCGHHVEVLDDARRLVAAHPLRERLTAQMATCLDRIGRPIEALRVCRDLRARLSSELGVDAGDEIDRLERDLTARRRSIDRVPQHLPVALTRFVGRVHELAEIAALRSDHRMLTLTGVGGVGKTRLALEAAATQTHHSVGVWLVELTSVRDESAVPGAVADVFGLATAGAPGPTTEVIAAWIGGRRLVVVLDNAEHVTAGAGRLARALLTACPNLSVLATSRMALHVPGEVIYAVPPMGVGGDDGPADAVTLFLERAAMARPATPLSRREQAAAAQVCRRLDGIPLAIELAAARVRMLSVDELAARLDDVLSMLSAGGGGMPDRHRTMRAALDWSHELLTADERAALRRLAVFPGDFDLDAAIGVVAGVGPLEEAGPDGFSVVADLVDRSWIELAAGGTRYRVLEPVRQYAAERLAAAGETSAARRAHRDVYRCRCASIWPLLSAQQRRRAYADRVHLRVATEWSWEQGEAAAALELVTFQVESWMLPRDAEMLMWLERVLADPAAAAHPLRSRVLALLVLTLADCGEGASPRIEVLAREAAELADDSEDPVVRASVNLILVEWAISRQRFAEARARTLEAMEVYRRARLVAGVAWCQHYLGWMALVDDDWAGARSSFELAVELARDDPGGEWLLPHAQAALAPVVALLGDGRRADDLAGEALEAARSFEVRAVLAMALVRAAEAHVIAGHDDRAAVDIEELLHLLRELGTRRWLADVVELTAVVLARRERYDVAANALGTAAELRAAAREPCGGVRAGAAEVRRTVDVVAAALGPEQWARAFSAGQLVAPEAMTVQLLAALADGRL